MKKIITIVLGVFLIGTIASVTTTKNVQTATKTETVYVNGMKYVVFHYNGNIQVVNVSKDLLEIAAYKKN